MDNATLIQLQNTEYEILCKVDDFCRTYGISYSLWAGTALGAVRHGGFIPWDDDIDIAMTRVEFDHFCKTWKAHPQEGFYLESILTCDNCGTSHAKIRKDGTVFLSYGDYDDDRNHGIWVDIFPLDKIPNDAIIRAIKIGFAKELILLTRANLKRSTDTISKRIIRGVFRAIPRRIRQKRINYIHAWMVKNIDKSIEKGYVWKSMSTMGRIKEIYFNPGLASAYTTISFNGRQFSIFRDYDQMLKQHYGNYLQLPPEEERVCKHAPIKIKF